MKFTPKILSIGCWNIEGIYEKVNGCNISKLDDEIFLNTLKLFDIFCLQETHTQKNDCLRFKDFATIPQCRTISGNKRYFGGLLLFIRRTIKKGVKVNKKVDDDSLEVILDSKFFGLSKDIRILFTYASPITSSYTRSRDKSAGEN